MVSLVGGVSTHKISFFQSGTDGWKKVSKVSKEPHILENKLFNRWLLPTAGLGKFLLLHKVRLHIENQLPKYLEVAGYVGAHIQWSHKSRLCQFQRKYKL